KTFKGTIGTYAVTVMIQQYAGTYHGTYYYDKYRSPILIVGSRHECGKLILQEYLTVRNREKSKKNNSIFEITETKSGYMGVWKSRSKEYPVNLISTDANKDLECKTDSGTGTKIVPFIGQTKKHMFMGYYSPEYHLKKVEIINKTTGSVDQTICYDDIMGNLMTWISFNILNLNSYDREYKKICGYPMLKGDCILISGAGGGTGGGSYDLWKFDPVKRKYEFIQTIENKSYDY
ncbi:MAG: hypothetical protein ACLFVQ_12430, partial [Chitinispirillaceae bacterium]